MPGHTSSTILQQLQESEEKFKKAFEASPAGMAITRANDTAFVDVNNSFCELIGFSKEEIIGKSTVQLGIIMEGKEREKILHDVNKFGRAQNTELSIKIKSGKIIHVLTSIETIYLQGEKSFLTIHYDITARKFAEEALQRKTEELARSNHELEQFTYIASHDLQEPLRTVSNYVMVFEEDFAGQLSEDGKKHLRAIDNATKRMSNLVKTLLDFSRLGKNKTLAHVNCKKIIDEVISDLGEMVNDSGAVIKTGEMPTLNLYETEVRQLFQNLISNAIKFRKRNVKPEIEINAEKFNDKWRFSVSDNGIGIESKYFDRIFHIFQRLHSVDEYEGSGIGLANCKKIVEMHHGEIWVKSIFGKGATFYFTL